MDPKKWFSLKKTVCNGYRLEADSEVGSCACPAPKIRVTQLAFDENEERLLAADSKGLIYYVELGQCVRYYKFGNAGPCTFVAFNPSNKQEIIVGLTSAVIKILRLDRDAKHFCALSGHKFLPKHISFYKHFCLTSSCKEVIIWDLTSCCKAHQLLMRSGSVDLRKVSFSSTGLIVALYRNSMIQVWLFKEFKCAARLDSKTFGLRNVKDFEFTKDGRALILGGFQNKILVINTFNWNLIKRVELPDDFIGTNQLAIVPKPLDGGANNILAVLSSHRTLHFLDLKNSCFLPSQVCEPIGVLYRIAVSSNGRYVAYLESTGDLILTNAERLIIPEPVRYERATKRCRPLSHSSEDHLICIRRDIKDELNLKRLLSILKEFGEFPRKHRTLIWSSILELPGNRNAYAALASKAPQGYGTEELLQGYPLADRSRASLLAMTINCLVHWCPLLSQSTFLPRLVFPFLVVFQEKPILAFEAVLSLLSNYCQRWFEYHPLPPLNVLASIENVLSEADPMLLNFFCERGVTSSEYAWPLLQTALSEVLPGNEWLILWDHILSSHRPSLFLMSALAYSICAREIIISQLKSSEDFQQFYHAQGHVRVVDLLRVARQLDHVTPSRLHPSRYFRDPVCPLPSMGPYPPFLLHQYPKFLTEGSQVEKLDKLKEQEFLRQEREWHALKLEEDRRLRNEREKFLREIHETRINQLRSCFEAKVRDEEQRMEASKEEAGRQKYNHKSGCSCNSTQNLSESRTDDERIVSGRTGDNWRAKNCETLQNEVEKLELEVKTLLETIEPSAVTADTV